jgi:glycosyltransferase involved in cell wall biosynthesis
MKVRVLHVIDSFDLGGGQTALANLIRATDRERYEPEVACLHGRGVFWEEFGKLDVPVHSLSPRKWLPLYLPGLIRLILSRRPRIVHCHLFASNWIAKPLAALCGVPVRINHDQCNDALRYERPLARWLDALTNRLFSSHVCAVSGTTRAFLLQHEGLAPDRVSVVYNGVDLSRFAPRESKPSSDRFIVLGVGRLTAQKNFRLFLEVAATLLRRNVPVDFRIAGTGPEEAGLRKYAEELGIAERVAFLGHVHDTQALYTDADALLMTSKFEGTPLVILEAMAMRLPIVAPRLDGIGEILDHESDALLMESGASVDFAHAIARLAADRALGDRLAATAERKVRERFSAEAMAAQVESIYERCLHPVKS